VTETIYKLRARVAALSKTRPANDAELIEAKSSLKASVITDRIQSLSQNPPPLTARQREVILSAFAGFKPQGGDGA
jgi:predicted DNA binding protein